MTSDPHSWPASLKPSSRGGGGDVIITQHDSLQSVLARVGLTEHMELFQVCTCTSDCLGCAVLLCLVCLFDLACFFLSSLYIHGYGWVGYFIFLLLSPHSPMR